MRLTKKEARALGLGGKKPRPPEPISGVTFSSIGSVTIKVLNWHPAKINEWAGRHWSVKRRLKEADYDVLDSLVIDYARACLATPRRRRVSLEITLGPRNRQADPDAYWKLLLDNLVALGLLVDDSPQWVELGPVTFQKGAKQTLITLVDL